MRLLILTLGTLSQRVLTRVSSGGNATTNTRFTLCGRYHKKEGIIKRKQFKKPWISNAIMSSIKKKQKLFKTHLLSNDQDKIKKYNNYTVTS